MNRTITTLALAAPLATIALSLGATPAMAEPAGPGSDQITSTKFGPINPHLPEDPEEQNPQNDPDPEPDPDPEGSDRAGRQDPAPQPVLDARRASRTRIPCRRARSRRILATTPRTSSGGRHPAAELHRRRCRLERGRHGARLADGRRRARHGHRRGVRRPPPVFHGRLTTQPWGGRDRPYTSSPGGVGAVAFVRRPRPGTGASGCRLR